MISILGLSDLENGRFIDEYKKYKKNSLISGNNDAFR